MPTETVTVGGVGVALRGLSVAEMRELQALSEKDTEAAGLRALALATDSTDDEVEAWLGATSPQFGLEVAEHVMRLSGHTEAAAARFPAGVHDRDGRDEPVRPGGPDGAPPAGDP
jgi:hypothetical protein